ncbi:MAG TPA: HAD family hydrolase [Aliidongia sp.]|uniref:HAD family hydrolase n=1 Tax=Aliidongia sp. TaxID=1914230 RepID=UPI002DDCD1F6|nr:HAD family hydrolase [Aliidongia sp.]HEV2677325.1 HAD family hydrolase [Aliidongia sp.]
MAKAVIFDIDGTLLDSVDLHARAWVEAFRDFGHTVEFQEVRGQIGKGGDQLLPVFLSPAEIGSQGEGLEKHRSAIFKERYLPEVMAFPDVRRLFQRLLEHGMKVALASSAKGDELETYKQIAGIEDLIDAETSSDDADKSKPHPDIFEAAIQRLGAVPRAAIYVVGDTPYDAEAAGKAGLRTIGVTCGGWSEDELKRAGCIEVYADPADLLDRYDESPLAEPE